MSYPARAGGCRRGPVEHDERHLGRAAEAEGKPVPEARRRVEARGRFRERRAAGGWGLGTRVLVRAPPARAGMEAFEEASSEEPELTAVRVARQREIEAVGRGWRKPLR